MSNNNSVKRILYNGLIKENPIFVFLLGMCPTLGTTSTALNGFYMGLATMFVLTCSNATVSLLKNIIPDKVRLPSLMVIFAAFGTIVELLMQAYTPSLFDSLGLFIPLIVVNCIVLGRAVSFASKNNVFKSIVDGIGVGLGFTFALTLLGVVRELLGTGKVFDYPFYPESFGILMMVLAPGAFIALGYLIAVFNKIRKTS